MTTPNLPDDKPRHLLGIADIPALERSVAFGMDTFDSCYPMRSARHGVLFTQHQSIKITASRYKNDFTPLDAQCQCHTCRHYTRGYLHHLFKTKEPTALTLASIHNLQAMLDQFSQLREKIANDQI